MTRATSKQLADGIRKTIPRLEQMAGLPSNDPSLVALKLSSSGVYANWRMRLAIILLHLTGREAAVAAARERQ